MVVILSKEIGPHDQLKFLARPKINKNSLGTEVYVSFVLKKNAAWNM
jgi:hypothetical protein